MTKQKGKGYQGIRKIFEYENTRSDFKHYYQEKWKTMSEQG